MSLSSTNCTTNNNQQQQPVFAPVSYVGSSDFQSTYAGSSMNRSDAGSSVEYGGGIYQHGRSHNAAAQNNNTQNNMYSYGQQMDQQQAMATFLELPKDLEAELTPEELEIIQNIEVMAYD